MAAGFWDKIAAAVWDEGVACEREILIGELRSGAYEGDRSRTRCENRWYRTRMKIHK